MFLTLGASQRHIFQFDQSRVAIEYYDIIKVYLTDISFEKVRGHQGVKWNEYADALAKKGIEELK